MRVGTITFHAAYNFGSALQAYALQSFVEELAPDIQYDILNFRSTVQKKEYDIISWKTSSKEAIKYILRLPYRAMLIERQRKFEEFIANELHITEEVSENDDIPASWEKYDLYISGSDQLWNVRARDFNDLYYLPFIHNARKISYAASFGPLDIDWSRYNQEKYIKYLNEYACISVREEGGRENIVLLIGRDCQVHVDPTLLLSVEKWRAIQSNANYQRGQYILLYCLEPSREQLRIAKAISKKLCLPIVAMKQANKNDMFNSFVKKYDAGPKDFLSYIDHAALVLTSSFHGTAFSLIYHKPFYALNGMNDKRISSILKKTGTENRAIASLDEIDKVSLKPLDDARICAFLSEERERSKNYLKEAMMIG